VEEWRRLALDLFPYLREDLEEDDSNIYTIFFEILSRCKEAHERGEEEELGRIYSYAEWCFNQEDKTLWNAAGVAFYEHLVDEAITRTAIPQRLKPDIFKGVSSLFEFRLSADEYNELKEVFYKAHTDAIEPQVNNSGALLSLDYSI
jgi:hypothetical protein